MSGGAQPVPFGIRVRLRLNPHRQLFRRHWHWDIWHEVLRLLCGTIGAEHAGNCISQLLEQVESRDGYRAAFLAANRNRTDPQKQTCCSRAYWRPVFRFPSWVDAARDLVQRWRQAR